MEGVPEWFRHNVQTSAVSRFTRVKGVSIHYRLWGGENEEKPGILLIHGGFAHSHWWDWIAPEFLDAYRVAAMDLSGGGESDHKEVYAVGDTAAEINAVCREAGFGRDAFLVAHSFGVIMAMQAALRSRGHYRGLIGIEPPPPGGRPRNESSALRAVRLFPTRSDAIGSFRLGHEVRDPYLVRYLAEHSVKETDGGWTWKVDRNWRQRSTPDGLIEADPKRPAKSIGCPLALVLGSQSEGFNEDWRAGLQSVLGAENVITIEDAGHHAHLDQPLAVARVLKEILTRWQRVADLRTHGGHA